MEGKFKMITDEEVANLSTAFHEVANPADWKAPIAATIDAPKKRLVARAIEFFTATKASFTPSSVPGFLHVSAAGYRAGPAGDN